MNWTVEYIQDQNFVTVVTGGSFNITGHAQMIEDILAQDFWKPGLNVLFDHRNFDFGLTDFNLMKQAGSNHEKQNERIGSGKAAILMKSIADFGRGRQFELLTADNISASIRIFIDENEALEWLL